MGKSAGIHGYPGVVAGAIAEWKQLLPVTGMALEPCSVMARRKTLLKIVRKHVGNRAEPWSRVLPASLFDRLSAFAAGTATAKSVAQCPDTLLIELAGVIGEWAREAAEKPRLLCCWQQEENAVAKRWSVLHVARCGAYVLVDTTIAMGQQRNPANLLKTCFFGTPHPEDHPPGNAWRTMTQRAIWQWASYDPRFGAFRIQADEMNRHVPQETGETVVRWHPRFVTDEHWGIRELADGTRGFRSLPTGAW